MRKLFWEMSSRKPWPATEIKLHPVCVSTDSTAAQALAKNKQVSARRKHIDLKMKFVNEALASGIITLSYVESAKNVADILTKALAIPPHKKLCELLRLVRG